MALSIKDRETDRLARKLARLTGESITKAVKAAIKDRLDIVEYDGVERVKIGREFLLRR